MNELIAMAMEMIVNILGELALAAIGVAGTWVLAKIAENTKLKNIEIATGEVIHAARESAAALQQTTVEGLKAASQDGKLSEDEVKDLGLKLFEMTMKKLSVPTINLLEAAGKDIRAMIQDAAEDWIAAMKAR